MTAVAFMIWNRSHTSVVGVASVCLEARYASVRWAGAERLDRRFADLEGWRAVANEIGLKLPAKPLTDDSPIAKLLAGERVSDVRVQYLTQEPISETDPRLLAAVLDDGLRSATIPDIAPEAEDDEL